MKENWSRFPSWTGWKRIFFLPFFGALLLFAASCAGLIWVFQSGAEYTVPAYLLYGLSAYALTSLCVKLPEGLRAIRKRQEARANHMDQEKAFRQKLYSEQFINFAYGSFKTVSGIVIGSAWIGCDGIYNLAQALIQLFQILKRKNPGSIEQQWHSYRICGWLILLMHLTLIGIVFQMVNWNRVEENGEVQVIATAAFAFYKLINSFIGVAKDRKHIHPIDSSVRMLELTQADFAIFSLQASMLYTFGTGESWEHWMNLAVGCIVCMLVCATGIYMIRRGSREIKQLQEMNHGQ